MAIDALMLIVTKASTFSSLFSGSGVYILHNSGTFFPLIGKKRQFFNFFHKTKDPYLPFSQLWGITTPAWFQYFPSLLLWTKWLSFDAWADSQLLEIVLLVYTVCGKASGRYQTKPQDKNQIFAANFAVCLIHIFNHLKLTYYIFRWSSHPRYKTYYFDINFLKTTQNSQISY